MKNKKGFTLSYKSFAQKQVLAKLKQLPSRFLLTGLRCARPSAFTLAEVLITLSILGVVAAITIPNITRGFQDRAQITGLKRAYSIIDNAIQMLVAINGSLNTWNWPIPDNSHPSWENQSNSDFFAQQLALQLNLQKYHQALEAIHK